MKRMRTRDDAYIDRIRHFFETRGERKFREFVILCNSGTHDMYDIAKHLGCSRVQACRLKGLLLDAIYVPRAGTVKILQELNAISQRDIDKRNAIIAEGEKVRERLREWTDPKARPTGEIAAYDV